MQVNFILQLYQVSSIEVAKQELVYFNSDFPKDIIFIVDGEEIGANKSILADKSPFFASFLLDKDNLDRLEISNEAKEVFEQLLHYFYTGKAPSMDLYAIDLLAWAFKVMVT